MKPHTILKDFPGTQDGHHDLIQFKAGTTADLSRGLAAIVVKQGWAKPHVAEEVPAVNEQENEMEEKSIESAPENKMRKPVKGKK